MKLRLFFVLTTVLAAQPLGQFDVVSIKPSKPGAVVQDMHIALPPGRMEALNITLNELLLSLSGFSGRVEGGPKWASTDRYDVIAKAEVAFKTADVEPMLLSMLADRFKLEIHREPREESAVALAKGKLPPDVKPATGSERIMGRIDRVDDQRKVIFRNVSMADFIGYLRGMGTPVMDHTGMPDRYDFTLDPDSYATTPSQPFRDRLRPATEALGFKFEPLKITRQIIVIDRAERPTAN